MSRRLLTWAVRIALLRQPSTGSLKSRSASSPGPMGMKQDLPPAMLNWMCPTWLAGGLGLAGPITPPPPVTGGADGAGGAALATCCIRLRMSPSVEASAVPARASKSPSAQARAISVRFISHLLRQAASGPRLVVPDGQELQGSGAYRRTFRVQTS